MRGCARVRSKLLVFYGPKVSLLPSGTCTGHFRDMWNGREQQTKVARNATSHLSTAVDTPRIPYIFVPNHVDVGLRSARGDLYG